MANGEKPIVMTASAGMPPITHADDTVRDPFRNPAKRLRGRRPCPRSYIESLPTAPDDHSPDRWRADHNFCVVVDDWDMEITHVVRVKTMSTTRRARSTSTRL